MFFILEFDINPAIPSYGICPTLGLIAEGVSNSWVGQSLSVGVGKADESPKKIVMQGKTYSDGLAALLY